MNELLKNVHIGSSSPEELVYIFKAFSIKCKRKNYIITAGHCVADNYGEEGVFKFKANLNSECIYSDLLDYKPEFYNLDDYGIFYSDKITDGLEVGSNPLQDNYLLESTDKFLSIFRNIGDSPRIGESGNPVINQDGQVVGIYVIYGLVIHRFILLLMQM